MRTFIGAERTSFLPSKMRTLVKRVVEGGSVWADARLVSKRKVREKGSFMGFGETLRGSKEWGFGSMFS
jgi:hypothetical protein